MKNQLFLNSHTLMNSGHSSQPGFVKRDIMEKVNDRNMLVI